jgi:hypothetical protein
MGIVISNNNWDKDGNPTIYNGGTATTNSVGEDISRDTSAYEKAKASGSATDPAGSGLAVGKAGMLGATGVYMQNYARPDGTFYQVRVNEDGSAWEDKQPYTQSELDSGIRIGGDTRTNERIASDYRKTQADYRARKAGSQPPAPPLPGADPLKPTYPAPGGTTSGAAAPPPIAPVNPTPTNPTPTNPYMNEHNWGASNVGTAGFQWGEGGSGGDAFKPQKVNPDGSISWLRSDGVQATLTRDEFESWFPKSLADVYYTGGTSAGGNVGTSGSGTAVGQGGTTSGNSTVGTADWSTQAGHNFTLPDGKQMAITSVNQDGTLTLRRSDGSIFSNVSRDVFESLLGKEAADQWYSKMKIGRAHV